MIDEEEQIETKFFDVFTPRVCLFIAVSYGLCVYTLWWVIQ